MANKSYILNYKALATRDDGTLIETDRAFALFFDGIVDEKGRDKACFFPKSCDKKTGERFAQISTQPGSKKVKVMEWLLESNRKGSPEYPPVDLYPFIDDPNYTPPAIPESVIEAKAEDDTIPF